MFLLPVVIDGPGSKSVIVELIDFIFVFYQSIIFLLQHTVFIQGLKSKHCHVEIRDDKASSPGSGEHSKTNHHLVVMRQLKGKPKKETSKDKKERKQAMQEARQQVATVVLPTLAVVVLLIIVFVYVATRPDAIE